MFLFLSKLLPLLVYPLGLASVLMAVTVWGIWRKRQRLAMASTIAAFIVLWAGSNAWVATRLMQSLEWQNLPPTPMPTADAIVVLGGCTRAADAPRPWVDVNEAGDRVLHGAQLYNAGKAPKLILSGGRIEWKGGGPPEAEDMAQIAVAMGVPKTDIITEPTSLNTYQNAVNVKAILQQEGIERILLVTSAMHMPRSLAIFQKQGIDAIAAPTDFQISERRVAEVSGTRQAILLSLLPDAYNLQDVSRAMKEYLGLLIYRLRGWL
ncbi:YdcF family protein [Leptolyngbya iicbica]|uniref:YdcF family protein n=2 Tax=Cyanophyceae TaxID=3028117 RepID=A0A4Q7E6M4_9CYAN|nr:YdcF family protein [Leptolyngbya sp. LK]RZM77863.1 YdcF family protein [Leptolyngbya sp. LK]